MKRMLAGLLAALALCGAPLQSEPPSKKRPQAAIIWSGNSLYDMCRHYETEGYKSDLGAGCAMYISGVAQTLVMNDDTAVLKSPCPGKMVTNEQIVDVVTKWLDNHPEKRNLPAPFIVTVALNEAFPCK